MKAWKASDGRRALALGVVGALVAGLIWDPGVPALAGGVAFAAAGAGLSAGWRFVRMKGRVRKLEIDLPLALLTLSVYLDSGLSFEAAMDKLGLESAGVLGEDLRRMGVEARDRGRAWPAVLSDWAQAHASPRLIRMVQQWTGLTRWGDREKSSEALRDLARDLLEIERTRLRALSAKMAMGSMVLVIVTAIVPALFLGFSLLASRVLDFSFSALEVYAIVLVGFPVAGFFAIGVLYAPLVLGLGGDGS